MIIYIDFRKIKAVERYLIFNNCAVNILLQTNMTKYFSRNQTLISYNFLNLKWVRFLKSFLRGEWD